MVILNLLLIIIVFAIVIIFIMAVQQPDEFRVTRDIMIDGSPDDVFDHINNLKRQHEWSPWVEMDPDAHYEFDGPEEGEGAIIHWKGDKTGVGKMTIVESNPSKLIRSQLDFQKPMQATNIAEFILEKEGNKTHVTSRMVGPNKFMGKVFGVFMNMQKICGDQFEKGLQNLKAKVEA